MINGKNFFINHVTKECKPKLTKKRAESAFVWFDLMWGLKNNKNLMEKINTFKYQ